MSEVTKLIHKYLRHEKKFPHVWCPGCGNGIVLGALIRAIDRTGFGKDDIVLVSGIGCAGRMSVYVDFNTLHTTHGRALTFATGRQTGQPQAPGDRGHGGRRRHRHRRQPFHPRRPAQPEPHGHHHQQQHLRHDRRPVFAHHALRGASPPPRCPATWSTPFPSARWPCAPGPPWWGGARSTTPPCWTSSWSRPSRSGASRWWRSSAIATPSSGPKNKLGGPVEMMRQQKELAVRVDKARTMSPEELAGKSPSASWWTGTCPSIPRSTRRSGTRPGRRRER